MIPKVPQGLLLVKLRGWYNRFIRFPFLTNVLKKMLRGGTTLLARSQKFYFPPKYDWDWQLEMLLQRYEPETTALVRNYIKPGMIVVDVGAHIGYYTRIFARCVGAQGKVFAFEPATENFPVLKQNAKSYPQVTLEQQAVSDTNGTITFYEMPNSTALHSIIAKDLDEKPVSVPATTLDAYIANHKIPHVDFIKIDIEGGEPHALRGATHLLQQPHLMMILEFIPDNFSRNNVDPLTFLKDFSQRGFTVSTISKKGVLHPINLNQFNLTSLMNKKEALNLFFQK